MKKACDKCDPSPKEAACISAAELFTRTPLMKAAKDGHAKCAEALINQGADVNAYDEHFSTALIRAADKGMFQCVKLLLDAGADVNSSNMYGINALISAAYGGHVDCVRVLLEKRASHNAPKRKHPQLAISSPLYYAVVIGDGKIVDLLLRSGASVLRRDNGDCDLIMLASESYLPGHLRCLELLIKSGASVNTCIANSESVKVSGCALDKIHVRKAARTPVAAAGNNKAKLRLLIEAGADVNSTDRDGITELMYAAAKGRATAVKLLLEAGANVNAKDLIGRGPLSYAAVGHLESLLMSEKLFVYVPNEGTNECTKLMVDAGADVNMRDIGRQTPSLIAVKATNVKCLKVLLKAGADVNAVDAVKNFSPLAVLKDIIYSHMPGKPFIHQPFPVDFGKQKTKKQLFSDIFTCCQLLLAANARVNTEFDLRDDAARADYSRQEGYKQMIERSCEESCKEYVPRAKSLKLLYAAGEMQGVAAAPGVTAEERMSLAHMCREKIRNHLIDLDPHENLFVRIHMLGLDDRPQSYLLYGMSLEMPVTTKRQRRRKSARGTTTTDVEDTDVQEVRIRDCGISKDIPWIGPSENDEDNDDVPLCRGCKRPMDNKYERLHEHAEENMKGGV